MTNEVSYLTTAEVAAELRVDPSTVRRWADSGELASVKTPGGQYRFARAVVDALLSPQSTPSSAMPTPDGLPPADEGAFPSAGRESA